MHDPLKLDGRFGSILQRYCADTDKTIRRASDEFGHPVVDHAGCFDTDVNGNGVVALRRRRHHDLPIDPHLVEVAQPFRQAVVLATQAGMAIGLLLLIDFVCFQIREKRQGSAGSLQVCPDNGSGRRNRYMRVNIDRAA